MATMTGRPVIVAVFEEYGRAQAARNALLVIGVSPRQLGWVVRHGELLQTNGTLVAVDVPEHDLAGGLIALGVPVVRARAVVGDFELGRTVLAVQPEQLFHQAESLLEGSGARSVLCVMPPRIA
jgi:hypothetical protein